MECKERIDIGETCYWERGIGVKHVECPEGIREDKSALVVIEEDQKEMYGY